LPDILKAMMGKSEKNSSDFCPNSANSDAVRELVLEARKGNLESFENLVFIFEKSIFGYLLYSTGRKEDAEDLTQEVFIKVYKNLKSLDPNLNFKAWLFKIASNTLIDWWRKKGEERELFLIDDKDSNFETIDEDFSYLKIETAKDIADALEKIKPEYKVVLLLFYWQGFSYEEIASILSLPLGTVKTNLRRAKLAIKEILTGAKR
jgi:RNA polymerase sigma-70 factor (ECF subfamily)